MRAFIGVYYLICEENVENIKIDVFKSFVNIETLGSRYTKDQWQSRKMPFK